MMVAIAPENLREKMKMVPEWLREEPGGFARIAKNEKHVTCRSGKRESGGARTTPEDKDYPYYQTFYFGTRGEPAGLVKALIDFALSGKSAALMTKKGMLLFVSGLSQKIK
jgi:hypothetical protein